MDVTDSAPERKEKKVEIVDEPESTEDVKVDEKDTKKEQVPSGLEKINFLGPPLKEVPSFSVTGKDVSDNASIQEYGFLSILNLIGNESDRADFIKWAKVEALKQQKDKKKDSKTSSTMKDVKASRPISTTLPESHVKESTRHSIPKGRPSVNPRIKTRTRRIRR